MQGTCVAWRENRNREKTVTSAALSMSTASVSTPVAALPRARRGCGTRSATRRFREVWIAWQAQHFHGFCVAGAALRKVQISWQAQTFALKPPQTSDHPWSLSRQRPHRSQLLLKNSPKPHQQIKTGPELLGFPTVVSLSSSQNCNNVAEAFSIVSPSPKTPQLAKAPTGFHEGSARILFWEAFGVVRVGSVRAVPRRVPEGCLQGVVLLGILPEMCFLFFLFFWWGGGPLKSTSHNISAQGKYLRTYGHFPPAGEVWCHGGRDESGRKPPTAPANDFPGCSTSVRQVGSNRGDN